MKNLLVSFSGGETSAFMAQWLNRNYEKLGYENIVFVFANTGLEREETLEFSLRCDKHFQLNLQWIEADIIHEYKKGTRHYMIDFDTANRSGEPFEQMIKKYGIPNQANPQCTRELKGAPILSFGKQYFNGEKYHTAIGIRRDEVDRINAKAEKLGFIYPLIDSKMIPVSKPMVNFYWRLQPFRLELKGYEGNCKTCWKKSYNKLYQIAKENYNAFDFMKKMEEKYGNFFPPQRIEKWIKEGKEIPKDITFFRGNRSALQIIEESKNWNGIIKDDSDEYNYQTDLLGGDGESCEVFSECSDT